MAATEENPVLASSLKKTVMPVVGVVWALCVQAGDSGFPAWLGGKPDIDMKPDRCGVYEWFLNEADGHTEGTASKDQLVSARVINIANKLVDHHQEKPAENYSGEVRYLVFGESGPFHFEFHISHEKLEILLNKNCDN